MVRPDAARSYTASEASYNWRVSEWTIGDVIRKARIARHWSQTKLGTEAASYQIGGGTFPINKSTVSKVEKDPYSSELGTVWRLLAALRLTFAEVEGRIGAPFPDRQKPSLRVSESHATKTVSTRTAGAPTKSDGPPLANASVVPDDHTAFVPRATHSVDSGTLADIERHTGTLERRAARLARKRRAAGKRDAKAGVKTAGGRKRVRSHRD